MTALVLAALLDSASLARAQAPAQAAAAPPAAATLGSSTATISTLYTGDRVRDPFLSSAMGGGSSRKPAEKGEGGEPEVVDIHALTLRGIMKDSAKDYALFSAESGSSYLLRDGKLFDERNKRVPGVTGKIKLKQKTVELMTAEKDVQVYRLGEDEKDKEKEKS